MDEASWSLIVSFVAMSFLVASYFFKNKIGYLCFQGLGIVFLILSYFFVGAYFAMLGISVGLVRVFVYFIYEVKGRTAPIAWAISLCTATVAAYIVVNVCLLKTARYVDILYLAGLVLYVFIMRLPSLRTVRFALLFPTAICLLYNILIVSTPFVIISYSFELAANVFSILKYHVFTRVGEAKKRSNTYEKDSNRTQYPVG